MDVMNQKVTTSSEVLCQQVDGESVLLDLKSESYFGLDPVGTYMWQIMEQHGDLKSVYEQTLQQYDVEPETLRQDIERLCSELSNAGLITLV